MLAFHITRNGVSAAYAPRLFRSKPCDWWVAPLLLPAPAGRRHRSGILCFEHGGRAGKTKGSRPEFEFQYRPRTPGAFRSASRP